MITETSNLDDFVKDLVASDRFKGVVAIRGNTNEITETIVHGYRSTSRNETLKPTDIFRIASMTKPITALAVLQLLEQGKLRLETKLSEIFHEFEEMRLAKLQDDAYSFVKINPGITIWHLLTHTSGYHAAMFYTKHPFSKYLQDYSTGIDISTTEKHASFLADYPLVHKPGERWSYGYSSDVLGLVIEKISGLHLEHYFQNFIFSPLGMKDTSFIVDEEKRSRLSGIFTREEDTLKEMREGIFLFNSETRGRGGSGLTSTPQDFAKFVQYLLKNTNSKEGDSSINWVKKMLTNQLSSQLLPLTMGPMELPDWGFGFGLGVKYGSSNKFFSGNPGSFYWIGAHMTMFLADPVRDSFICFFTQLASNNPIAEIIPLIDFSRFL